MKYQFVKLALTIAATISLVETSVNALNFNYSVSATANIHSAGLGAPVAPGGLGAGILPIEHTIMPGQSLFTFSASGLTTAAGGSPTLGPDGWVGAMSDVYAYGGISGFKAGSVLPLVGVFLDSNVPQSPAPATLQFTSTGLGLDFTTLSPAIGQVFFIGDGQTSGSVAQEFFAPAGATRLFLGFADAPYSSGNPGAYFDNGGSLNVTVTAVPEPTVAGFIIVSGLVASRWLKRRSH